MRCSMFVIIIVIVLRVKVARGVISITKKLPFMGPLTRQES